MAKIRVDGPILSPKLIKVGCQLSTKLGNLVKFAEILFVRLKNAPKTIFLKCHISESKKKDTTKDLKSAGILKPEEKW